MINERVRVLEIALRAVIGAAHKQGLDIDTLAASAQSSVIRMATTGQRAASAIVAIKDAVKSISHGPAQ